MTRIVYEPERFMLSMEGHAGAGRFGEDLICAGLSALWNALECVMTADRMSVRCLRPVIRYGDGLRAIECSPDEEMETACKMALRTAAAGMRWMAEKFPSFVSYEER